MVLFCRYITFISKSAIAIVLVTFTQHWMSDRLHAYVWKAVSKMNEMDEE